MVAGGWGGGVGGNSNCSDILKKLWYCQGNLPVHNSMDALAAAALSYDYDEGPKLVSLFIFREPIYVDFFFLQETKTFH